MCIRVHINCRHVDWWPRCVGCVDAGGPHSRTVACGSRGSSSSSYCNRTTTSDAAVNQHPIGIVAVKRGTPAVGAVAAEEEEEDGVRSVNKGRVRWGGSF